MTSILQIEDTELPIQVMKILVKGIIPKFLYLIKHCQIKKW